MDVPINPHTLFLRAYNGFPASHSQSVEVRPSYCRGDGPQHCSGSAPGFVLIAFGGTTNDGSVSGGIFPLTDQSFLTSPLSPKANSSHSSLLIDEEFL